MAGTQLILPVTLRDETVFDNFFVGSNAQLMHVVKNIISPDAEKLIYCYGAHGVGKTHLLQACCHWAQSLHHSIFYFTLKEYAELSPAIFDALEEQAIICIDDVDAIAGNSAWEEALFHFYNRSRDNQTRLLMSATLPPQQLSFSLKDLQSRLQLCLVMELHSLSDDEKIQALQIRAAARGLTLTNDVLQYCLHRHSRNMQDLLQFLDTLDRASLIAKRKITIPFIKQVLLESSHFNFQ